jgi:outer membrane protein, heavy metal efflux system
MFTVVIWALVATQHVAQAHDSLRLVDLYRMATQRNARIASAKALADAAHARIAATRRPPDPQIQFGIMNYGIPQWRAMDGLGMTQVQVMQMLPVGGKLSLAARAVELGADGESERAHDVQWDVRLKVASAYYELYTVDRSLVIDRQTLRLLEDALHVAETMYRVGEGRQSDVLRGQVEIARMAQDTIRMTSMRTGLLAQLASLTDQNSVAGSPIQPVFGDSVPSTEVLVSVALTERPMLRAGARDVAAAATRVTLASREIWPDLTFGVQYGQRGGIQGTERMASVMVGATLPVFARSRQLRMRDEALAMQQMSRAEFAALRGETSAAIADAHAKLVRARTLASSYRSVLLPQAEASSESALASYRTGRVDFMTLLDARMNINRFHKELVALVGDEGKAWAELEMLTGRELLQTTPSVATDSRAP